LRDSAGFPPASLLRAVFTLAALKLS